MMKSTSMDKELNITQIRNDPKLKEILENASTSSKAAYDTLNKR